jgi:hypothetical protein
MLRRVFLLLCLVVTLVGCGADPQQVYDQAVASLERAEARLDNLRPAFDLANEKAMLNVCKELTGTTPEESAMTVLSQLQGAAGGLAADAKAAAEGAAETVTEGAAEATAEGGEAAAAAAAKVPQDADAAIDQLLNAHQEIQKQGEAVAGAMTGAYETMAKIKTPGTPEAKKFEEVLEAMAEVKAYRRQEKRVAEAQAAVDAAAAALKGASGAGQ